MNDIMVRLRTIRPFLDRVGPTYVDAYLSALSALTVVLVLFSELPQTPTVTALYLGIDWTTFKALVQNVTWTSYFGIFCVYFITYDKKPVRYLRRRALELIICVTWIPAFGQAYLQLGDFRITDTWLLVGTVAHFLRTLKYIAFRWQTHPVMVITCSTASVVTISAVALMCIEPETFRNFQDSAWSMFLTSTTNGPTIQPNTLMGRVAFGVAMVCLMTIFAVFLAVVREFVHETMFKMGDQVKEMITQCGDVLKTIPQLSREIHNTHKDVQRLLAEGRKLRNRVDALEQHIKKTGGTPPTDDDQS